MVVRPSRVYDSRVSSSGQSSVRGGRAPCSSVTWNPTEFLTLKAFLLAMFQIYISDSSLASAQVLPSTPQCQQWPPCATQTVAPTPLKDGLKMGAKCVLIWILCSWHVGLTRHTVGFSLVQSLGDDSDLPRKGLSVLPRWTKLCQSPREGLIRCLWICEKEYSPLNKHVLLKNSL